jgi:hypothetical protein
MNDSDGGGMNKSENQSKNNQSITKTQASQLKLRAQDSVNRHGTVPAELIVNLGKPAKLFLYS